MGTSSDTNSLESETKEFAARLSALAQSVSKTMRGWRPLGDRLDDPARIVRWLEAAADTIDKSKDLTAVRERLLEVWREKITTALLQLEAELRDLCATKDWRLDGQWPDFVVNLGIPVHVDDKKRLAAVGDVQCPASAAAIVNTLEPRVAELLPKNFAAPRFMESVLRAYEAVGTGSGQAPIMDVYRLLVIQSQSARFWRDARPNLFTALTLEQFRARLSKSLETGVVSADSRELRLFPALDPKDAIFMYQPAERRFGYVGRIEFVEQTRGAR
jgi:hypothetical protein